MNPCNRQLTAGIALVPAALLLALSPARGQDAPKPLRMAVMDPLCSKLACACVKGHAQRRYDLLAEYLSKKLGRPVSVAYGETLNKPLQELGGVDLVIGKEAAARGDLEGRHIHYNAIARLTDPAGSTNLTGLFVVRAKSPIKTLADLRGKTIVLGPANAPEKHKAALAALTAAGANKGLKTKVAESCTIASAMLLAKEADAAVISSYAESLIYACGTAKKGSMRAIGKTAPVPFIAAFVTDECTDAGRIRDELLSVAQDRALLSVMESRDGFVSDHDREWSSFLGGDRRACALLPPTLPAKPALIWKRAMTGACSAGVSATTTHVVVADKDSSGTLDIFRCLSADTGEQIWRIAYPAPGHMDSTNAPRATPVIHYSDRVYTLGAFGDLSCVTLDTGQVVWRRNLAKDFGAKVPTWGYSSTPLIVGGRLLVNPGAPTASVVALDAATGKVLWRGPGGGSAYASLIRVPDYTILDVSLPDRYVAGFDSKGAGCWDVATGKRLCAVAPGRPGEFLVPTPVALTDFQGTPDGKRMKVTQKVLLAGENNGARLHVLREGGRIDPQPIATNPDFAPDTVTPVECDGLIFGGRYALMCLDGDLKTCWKQEEPAYDGHYSLIAGNHRVLALSQKGTLSLIAADRSAHKLIGRWQLPPDQTYWSYPAIVRDRLYVRSSTTLYCYRLT